MIPSSQPAARGNRAQPKSAIQRGPSNLLDATTAVMNEPRILQNQPTSLGMMASRLYYPPDTMPSRSIPPAFGIPNPFMPGASMPRTERERMMHMQRQLEKGSKPASNDYARSAMFQQMLLQNQMNPLASLGSLHPGTTRVPYHLPSTVNVNPAVVRVLEEEKQERIKDVEEEALVAIGSTNRNEKNGMYFDASVLSDPDPAAMATRRTRGGVTEPFPEKLHRMLADVEKEGLTDIVSFFPHGRAFGIHRQERFVKEILPKYFRQSQMSSFQRQLNLYGFTRISSGTDEGGYYHELFLKGRPLLCMHMRRVGVPMHTTIYSSAARRRKGSHQSATADPDFYALPRIKGATAAKQKTKCPSKVTSDLKKMR